MSNVKFQSAKRAEKNILSKVKCLSFAGATKYLYVSNIKVLRAEKHFIKSIAGSIKY